MLEKLKLVSVALGAFGVMLQTGVLTNAVPKMMVQLPPVAAQVPTLIGGVVPPPPPPLTDQAEPLQYA